MNVFILLCVSAELCMLTLPIVSSILFFITLLGWSSRRTRLVQCHVEKISIVVGHHGR